MSKIPNVQGNFSSVVDGQEKAKRTPLQEMAYMDEMNKRFEYYFDVTKFNDYQINPYTMKTLDFVTPKITDRSREKMQPQCVPGYCKIKESIRKAYAVPRERFFEPQTETHRFGWFDAGEAYFNSDYSDERFRFSHRTAEFIKTQAALREFDRIMGNLTKHLESKKAHP